MTPHISIKLVEAILRNPHGYQWSVQGLGMMRLYLDQEKTVRLHIWDSSLRTPRVSSLHTHPWDFTSYVVCGAIRNSLFIEVAANATPYQIVEIQCGPGGCSITAPSKVLLRHISSHVYLKGHSYCQRYSDIHDTAFDDGTVTLVQRTNPVGVNPDRAFVYWKDGPWVSAEPRAASRGEIERVTEKAIAVLEEDWK